MPAAAPKGAPSIVLPHQEASYVRHIALDIGGSLIKLVYFSPDSQEEATTAAGARNAGHGHHHKGGAPWHCPHGLPVGHNLLMQSSNGWLVLGDGGSRM